MKGNRLSWYRHVMRRDETHVIKRVMKGYEFECMERKAKEKMDGLSNE